MFVVIPGAPEIIEAIQPLLDHCPSSASCCLVAICIKGSFVIRVDCIDTANSLTAFEKLSTVPGCWKKKTKVWLVWLRVSGKEHETKCPSRFLYTYLFIHFFFVLLCEFADLLVAMGHVLMCEIKTSWVKEFGVTWANKVVKKNPISRVQIVVRQRHLFLQAGCWAKSSEKSPSQAVSHPCTCNCV